MTTAGQVLDVARSQIGTRESGDNRTKYGAAYGMDGVAWCAQFVWWCFREAGGSLLIPKTAYTPTLAAWFQARGQWSRTPRVGSLPLYNFPDSLDRIQHVGILEAVNADGSITDIEGNTSSGSVGSQDRGGGVWRRARSTSSIVGYGHPAYANAPAAAAPVTRLVSLVPGMTSDSRVIALQRWLNAHNWTPDLPLLTPDGTYGARTADVVRGAQQQCRVGVDGVVGPQTAAAFAARGARW